MTSAFETLSSLPAIRERATKVYEIAKAGQATNFDLDEDRLEATVDIVVKVILVSNQQQLLWLTNPSLTKKNRIPSQ